MARKVDLYFVFNIFQNFCKAPFLVFPTFAFDQGSIADKGVTFPHNVFFH